MATLVNKINPAIRMTAPEIDVHEEEQMYFIPVGNYCIPMCIDDWTLVEEEPEKHPDKFTDFEWLVGNLMFRGCDLDGMTDGEDDNGTVTKLIKDRAAETMELLERELDPNVEPADLEKLALEKYPIQVAYMEGLKKGYELGRKGGNKWK